MAFKDRIFDISSDFALNFWSTDIFEGLECSQGGSVMYLLPVPTL